MFRENVSNIEEKLNNHLLEIQAKTPGLRGFVVFTKDGFPIANTLLSNPDTKDTDIELLSAIGAGLLALSKQTLSQINIKELDRITVESPESNILLEAVDDDIFLMCIALPETTLGMVRLAMKKAADKVKEIVS